MADLRYDDRLDAAAIRQVSADTHGFWARGRSLPAHTERNLWQISASGGLCRYVGLRRADGDVVSALKWYELRLCGLSGEARTFGIGSVFTPERHRGRGLATRLLREALDAARRQGYGLSLLYSDIDPAFYARLGFVEFPATDWTLATASLPNGAPLNLRVATAADEAALIGFHEASFPDEWLWTGRPPALWRYLRRRNQAPADLLLVDAGEAVGYVNVTPDGRRLSVDEWAAPGVPAERVWATLRCLAAARGCVAVCGWERPGQTPAGASRTRRPHAIPMVAPLLEGDAWPAFLAETAAANRAFFGSLDHF